MVGWGQGGIIEARICKEFQSVIRWPCVWGFGLVVGFCLEGWGMSGGVGGGNHSTNSRLDEKDREILRCYSDDLSINTKAIAAKVGLHYTNVYKRLARPAMAEAVTEIKGSLDEILRDGKRLAAKKMKRLIMSTNESIALKASTEILKAELGGEQIQQQPIRFITVVNEVGVLESQAEPIKSTVDVDVIPAVTKPTD